MKPELLEDPDMESPLKTDDFTVEETREKKNVDRKTRTWALNRLSVARRIAPVDAESPLLSASSAEDSPPSSPLGDTEAVVVVAAKGLPLQQNPAYRRIWQSIVAGKKIDVVDRQVFETISSEVTLKDIVQKVVDLKAMNPISMALDDCLHQLDGRAVAALMKDLGRHGLPHRAAELFDYLRGLPKNHASYHLADLYTYTTAISQCATKHQIRRALDLVAEMRSRGLSANIHTYSALMSVCVKSNECDLALDVYQQLLEERISPNAVTANILIDVHGKRGNWAATIKVLEDLQKSGTIPEARTFNTVIASCARCNQADAANSVFESMLTAGVKPTVTTFTSLISAFGRVGRAEEAMAAFQKMGRYSCQPNVITYSSLISACEKAGEVGLAMQVFNEMNARGCKPNIVTYNAVIGACAQVGDWRAAEKFAESMRKEGCRPDTATQSVLIAAYERGGQWQSALSLFERMLQTGFKADASVYCSVIEALWNSGMNAAQLRAAQLFLSARSQGVMRSSHTAIVAHTYGAAFLAVVAWLKDMQDATFEYVPLSLVAGKHCRAGSPFKAIKQNLKAAFIAFDVPVSIHATAEGVLVEALKLSKVRAWLHSPSAGAMLSILIHKHVGLRSPSACGALTALDAASSHRCGEAYAAVAEFESSLPRMRGLVDTETLVTRQAMLTYIISLNSALTLSEEGIHDALQLCDRYLAAVSTISPGSEGAYASALLLLSAQQVGGVNEDVLLNLADFAHTSVSHIAHARQNIVTALQENISAISALRVLQLYIERLGGCEPLCELNRTVFVAAANLAVSIVAFPALSIFPASVLAAACLAKTRARFGMLPCWPLSLRMLTGYDMNPGSRVSHAARALDILGLVE